MGVTTNASAYYASFQRDIEPSTVILNFTIFINESVTGQPLGIFLSLTRNLLLQSIFGFDNGHRTKDYIFNTASTPDGYMVTNSIASWQEQVIITSSIPETLINSVVSLEISTVVLGSLSDSALEYDAVIFIAIHDSSGKSSSSFLITLLQSKK